ncbi:MAG: AAA family ATPase [Kofleriaceae bacterium]
MFVGRSRELALIEEAVADAGAGRRALLLITGEAGIGKTRLLEALASRITSAGGQAVWGRTWEVGLTPAFWPWTQVLGALDAPDDRAPTIEPDERVDSSTRLASFDAVAAFIARRAARRPIAILLDDVHAADPSSLLLLEFVARHVRDARIVVAATARDGEAASGVEQSLGRIRRDARRIALPRLDAAEVAAMVGSRLDAAGCIKVRELADGNPLFIEELVECLASAPSDARPLAALVGTGVRAVIRERVTKLAEPTAQLLAAAALVGREFRGAVVAAALDLDRADLERRLAPALRARVVSEMTTDRYRFSHALVAEVLADDLDRATAAELHLRAAQAIESCDDSPDAASAIAHHLLQAGHLAADAAVRAAERAADVALTQLAFEDAAAMLERALGALGTTDRDGRRQRAELMCKLAEALQYSGQHARASEICEAAAELARMLDDGALLARVALALGIELRFGLTDATLVGLLQEALRALPQADTPLRARVLARLAAAEQPALDPAGPVRDALAAIEMARRCGDPRTLLDVIHVAFAALIDYVPGAQLEALGREVLALATGRADRLIAIHMRLRLCFTAIDRRDRAAFDAAVANHATAAAQVGTPRVMWPTHVLRSMQASIDGRFRDARVEIEHAAALVAKVDDPTIERSLQIHRAMTDWIQTAPLGDDVRRLAFTHPTIASLLVIWVDAAAGRLDSIRDLLPQSDAAVDAEPSLALFIIDAVIGLGDRTRAEQLYAQLEAHTGKLAVASMLGFAILDIYDRALLVLATLLERWEVIDRHAETALQVAQQVMSPPWIARIQADWATALERRGRPEDRERAALLWTQALAQATRLEMPGLLARARSAQSAQSATPPPHTPPAGRSSPGSSAGAGTGATTTSRTVSATRVGELWIVRGFGNEVHVRSSRGMEMLARMLAEPGREFHAVDLANPGGTIDLGDAGELIDDRARAAYRTRLADLEDELARAEQWGDLGRAEHARSEIAALSEQLTRAVGLGGRERRAGQAAERARTNVQRRVSHAIQQVRAASQHLGEHLVATVRTGAFCVYRP